MPAGSRAKNETSEVINEEVRMSAKTCAKRPYMRLLRLADAAHAHIVHRTPTHIIKIQLQVVVLASLILIQLARYTAVTTMKFISRKYLLSSFNPVIAHP